MNTIIVGSLALLLFVGGSLVDGIAPFITTLPATRLLDSAQKMEPGNKVLLVHAVDIGGLAITYGLQGQDSERFTITTVTDDTGTKYYLTVKDKLDKSTEYEFDVTATNSNGETRTEKMIVDTV